MRTKILWFFTFTFTAFFAACSKSDFLDKKPSTAIITPSSLADLEHMLDNTQAKQSTGALSIMSDDDFIIPYPEQLAVLSATERNSCIWAKDIYGGSAEIQDWNIPFQSIFYSNSVLDVLAKLDSSNTERGKFIKGWALFNRAYAFYDLTRNFCKAYDAASASADLGIPLKLSSGINKTEQRTSLQKTFNQIIGDLNEAEKLLPSARPATNLNRPWKAAVYALLARIYLDMRSYTDAKLNAEDCLKRYHTLIDYNTVNQTASNPFSVTGDELIYNTNSVAAYQLAASSSASPARISPDLLNSYEQHDLRKAIYFSLDESGFYFKKRGYFGRGASPFTGLATDEVYLIMAECLAREDQTDAAMNKLNELLEKRFSNATPFVPLTANSPATALNIILKERRKELVCRGLRWHDLKRFNSAGENISLVRSINGINYTIPANDPRWVFPLPNDEINLSGIQQNER
jgi:hypothetical protein